VAPGRTASLGSSPTPQRRLSWLARRVCRYPLEAQKLRTIIGIAFPDVSDADFTEIMNAASSGDTVASVEVRYAPFTFTFTWCLATAPATAHVQQQISVAAHAAATRTLGIRTP
jgi:hypothetical protein